MTQPSSPKGWATQISTILSATFGAEHFPVKVAQVAQEYSKQIFPEDPVIAVEGDNLPGFEGGLFPIPKKGWAILYNNNVSSKGRVNFTLAHEFGHYLVHRRDHPNGFKCDFQDVGRWDSEYGQIEHQANEFAANLLMPFKDFRSQIDAKAKVNLEMLSYCAERYDVSLLAATSQWLKYTAKRAVLVVSRDGFIKWARSSAPAFKTGNFFKASQSTIEIPQNALPFRTDLLKDGRATIDHPPGVWFNEEVCEITLIADRYDSAISLLLLEDAPTFDLSEDDFI